jgi:hypothetical protein
VERGQGLKKAFIVHVAQARTIDKTRLPAPGIATLPNEMTAEALRAE